MSLLQAGKLWANIVYILYVIFLIQIFILYLQEIEVAGLSEEVAAACRKYLDRADVILLSKLTCKKTGKSMTVCNIHVVYDPKAPDVQCVQVGVVMFTLLTFLHLYQSNLPPFFCELKKNNPLISVFLEFFHDLK